ncbi:MAG TPA: antibiotic biosynthesis monooxygenase [Terricaulis sp.]|nr:antibiotic biosynthesis monooxygenase [Terricaulis sp.]
MIIVQGWIRLAPGGAEKLRATIAELMTATRQEAGCISYTLSADLVEPDLIHIAEIWDGKDALKAHSAAPHAASFGAAMRDAGVEGMNVKGYNAEFWRQILGGD